MDEINKIRKAFFTQGESKNAIARRFGRSWDTINRIVSSSREDLEHRGRRPKRTGKVVTPEVLQAIQTFLDEEKEKFVKKKQRYTAKKIYEQLRERGVYKGSEKRMQEVVKKLREKQNQSKKKSYLPLHFPLGTALQIDHGEADLIINGARLTVYLFVASVPGQVLRYCQVFPVKAQEAWGEFHERALRFFGGVFPRIVYDNDSVLVKKVLGTERNQTGFSLTLEEHFGFESHFCNVAAGNEKGAVENAVGYCRRNYLPGCPSFINWDEPNEQLEAYCKRDIYEGTHYKTKKPLHPTFEELKQIVRPLPPKKTWCKWLNCRVDSCQLISIDHHKYSVPEKYVGTSTRVALGVFQMKVFKEEELVAIHERKYGDDDSLNLDHYLDQLQYKSGALWDCRAVHGQKFDQRYLEIWRRLAEKFHKKEANRQFVKILLLGRLHAQKTLLEAVELSLKYGAIEYAAVENIVCQLDTTQPIFNEEELGKTLKSVDIQSWEFDLSPYAKLCEEVTL